MDVLLLTFNCGKAVLSSPEFEQVISRVLDSCNGRPNLLVFGFQEICPILNGCFQQVDEYFDPILNGISKAVNGRYSEVKHGTFGAVGLVVYASNELVVDQCSPIATYGCGYLNSSLKGAIGIRVKVESSEFTFVVAHLTANEGYIDCRNKDFNSIVKRMDFGDEFGVYKPNNHVFFMGDLNYRAKMDISIDADDRLLNDYSSVDELSLEMDRDSVFYGFVEAPIKFKPTYKFKVGTEIYNKTRIPSWCDRILYLDYSEPSAVIHDYNSIQNYNASDHKPVYLHISVPAKPPHNILSEDCYYKSTTYLGRDPNREFFKMYSKMSDQAIGWSLYTFTTKLGLSYLSLGLFMLYLLYSLY